MPTIAEFVSTQFKKANIAISAEVEDILKQEPLTKTSLPDAQTKLVNDALMTLDVAKENPILKQHFRPVYLNPIDEAISKTYLSEYGIDGEFATAINGEKSTYEKIGLMLKAVKTLEEKKSAAATGDKKSYIEKIDALNGQIIEEKNKLQRETARLTSENAAKELNWNIKGVAGKYNYSDSIPGDRSDVIDYAVNILNKQLLADGAKPIIDQQGQLRLVSASDPALDFTRENQKVNFSDYFDKLVADKKLIKTSEPAKPPAPGAPPPPIAPANPEYKVPQKTLSDLQQAMKDAGVVSPTN